MLLCEISNRVGPVCKGMEFGHDATTLQAEHTAYSAL